MVAISSDNDCKTTSWQTFVHMLKGYIGPGCLSLPWAFTQLGIPWGVAVTVVLFVLTTNNALALVNVKNIIAPNEPHATYSDVGEWIYRTYFLRILITLSVCAQQLGICTVYFAFIADNIISVVNHSPPHSIGGQVFKQLFSNYGVVVTLVLPSCLMLSLIPNLRKMAPVTQVATVFIFMTFGFILAVVAMKWRDGGAAGQIDPDHSAGDGDELPWTKIPMAICAILYSYEGINLVLPIESSMAHPSKFRCTFLSSMTLVCITFGAFASICVYTFGPISNGSITAYLVSHLDLKHKSLEEEWIRGLILSANALVSVSVLLTYPLQIFPCFGMVAELLRDAVKRRREGRRRRGRHGGVLLPTHDVEDGDQDEADVNGAGLEAAPVLIKQGSREEPGQHVNGKTRHDEHAKNEEMASLFTIGDDEEDEEGATGQNQQEPTNTNGESDSKPLAANGALNGDEEVNHAKPAAQDDDDDDQDVARLVQNHRSQQQHQQTNDDHPSCTPQRTLSSASSTSSSSPTSCFSIANSHFGDDPHDTPLMRCILVFSTYIVALTIPNVDELISLVGALAGAMNALILPPLLEYQCGWLQHSGQLRAVRVTSSSLHTDATTTTEVDEEEDATAEELEGEEPLVVPMQMRSYWTSCKALKCYFLAAVGVIAAVVGTAASAADIVHAWQSK